MAPLLVTAIKALGPILGKRAMGWLVRRRMAKRIDGYLAEKGLPEDKRDAVLDILGSTPVRRKADKPGEDAGDTDWHSGGA